jgi:hypothetical protein
MELCVYGKRKRPQIRDECRTHQLASILTFNTTDSFPGCAGRSLFDVTVRTLAGSALVSRQSSIDE